MNDKIKSVEHSGGNVNYYVVYIDSPKREEHAPYHAECEDIILKLGMTFSEGCVFKALWRSCAERTLGLAKKGGDAIYDAEKMKHYSTLTLKERKDRQQKEAAQTQTQTQEKAKQPDINKILKESNPTWPPRDPFNGLYPLKDIDGSLYIRSDYGVVPTWRPFTRERLGQHMNGRLDLKPKDATDKDLS